MLNHKDCSLHISYLATAWHSKKNPKQWEKHRKQKDITDCWGKSVSTELTYPRWKCWPWCFPPTKSNPSTVRDVVKATWAQRCRMRITDRLSDFSFGIFDCSSLVCVSCHSHPFSVMEEKFFSDQGFSVLKICHHGNCKAVLEVVTNLFAAEQLSSG